MFRKTFICVAGVIAGVSAGAYSSGFFNEENVVTTMYNQALDRMGLETQASDSISDGVISDGMTKDGMAGTSEGSSLVSAGLTPSGANIDNQTVTDAIGGVDDSSEVDPLFTESSGSESKGLARGLLEDNVPTRSAETKEDDAASIASRDEEEAVAQLAKEAEAAVKEAAMKKAELERRQANKSEPSRLASKPKKIAVRPRKLD